MTNDAQDFIPLKPDIFHILLALEGGPLHGYGIIAEVERGTSGHSLLPNLLYRRLARLTDEGIVHEVEVLSDQDPRRKHYALTPLGRAVLREEASRIVDLGRSLARYRWSES